MRKHYYNGVEPYTPKPLPLDEIFTIKTHWVNPNTLMRDIELFQGRVSILRKEVDYNEYRELENKAYQSQKLY